MLRRYGRSAANGVHPVVCAASQARGRDSEAERGVAWIDLRQAAVRGRGGRGYMGDK